MRPMPPDYAAPRLRIHLLILFSGFAALSWEMLWQIKSTLALGISALGAAITLAATMGGMSIGGFAMGRMLRKGSFVGPLRIYGIMEVIIGVAGLFLDAAFRAVERLDTFIYAATPEYASTVHALAIVAVLGVPAICMGATLPVFALMASRFRLSLAGLYGLNTLGAATGVLSAALVLIPCMGIIHTAWTLAAINIMVGIFAWRLDSGVAVSAETPLEEKDEPPLRNAWKESILVLVTGFATFTLEIAWFRSLAGTFPSTTDMFAVVLASMLIALGIAARSVACLKRKKTSLGSLLAVAGILILLATPVIERFDIYYNYSMVSFSHSYKGLLSESSLAALFYIAGTLVIFLATLCVIGPPVWFLGVAFPWILDDQHSSRRVGMLYALNTLAAIAGALGGAWALLPAIGFAKTAWIAGALVAVTGIIVAPARTRMLLASCGAAALLVAVSFESGIGKTRIQGLFFLLGNPKVLESYNGPDATVSVIEYFDGARRLLIDSASATGESGPKLSMHEHYMQWMGHLPMLLQPDPKNVLVICFGTGQTANAARRENLQSLDIVDVNPRIFRLAHNFRSNEKILNDPRVTAITMDGRAYMRRTRKTYDVITLEPMPPTYAGVNALYSREFYEAARARMTAKGVIAQWLPFHAVAPFYAASIARTFTDVFPNAVLWIDTEAPSNAILLGTKDDSTALGKNWPGFARTLLARDLSEETVRYNVALDTAGLKHYGTYGEVITDDNQLLAYGKALYGHANSMNSNYELLHQVDENIPPFMPLTGK